MESEYLVLAVVHVLCISVRTSYEVLKDRGRVNPKNPVLFGAVFTTMIVLWASWFALCPMDPVILPLSGAIRYAGFGVFLLGLLLAIGALVQLRGFENINHLVTNGLFAWCRHPMYTGFITWIFGWSVYHGAVVSFVLGMITTANILYWRRLEEKHLEIQFGDAYQDYKRMTWF